MKNPLLLIAMSGLLAACGSDDSKYATYDIRIQNLTHAQPLSPVGLIFSEEAITPWEVGQPSSVGLEILAEGGDNAQFLADADAEGHMTINGGNVVLPGTSFVQTVKKLGTQTNFTFASMLVNTNDAYTGRANVDLSALALGEQMSINLPVYDAGTEGNFELAGTIPGPADGGEGYNAERDDVDYVTRHPGVVTNVDAPDSSVLKESHRFDAPIARLVVIRVK